MKKIIALVEAVVFLLVTTTFVAIADEPHTNVYVIPGASDIGIGDTTYVRIACDTTQSISGWSFEYINFTQGIINVNGVRTGHYSPSPSDYYMFQDNNTMQGDAKIDNANGIIGGSWKDYYWEVALPNDQVGGVCINNTNRTMVNLTIQGTGCGKADITVYSQLNECLAFEGNIVGFTYHGQQITVHPAAPTSFAATPYQTQINLSWNKGVGSDLTVVRGKLGSYPTSISDGTWGTTTASDSVEHTGLIAGDHWYYQAWSLNDGEGLYSLTSVTTDQTVLDPPITTSPVGSAGGSSMPLPARSTPGFEILVVFSAVAVLLLLRRMKK